METITKRKAIALVKKYANAEPEKVANCSYVVKIDNEKPLTEGNLRPECIVGQILANEFHIDPLDLLEVNSTGAASILNPGYTPDSLKSREAVARISGQVRATKGAREVLDTVQEVQDGRHSSALDRDRPWAKAVPKALELLSDAG